MSQSPHHSDRVSAPMDIHRQLPCDLDAEKGLLGSILLNPDEVLDDCAESITEKSFYLAAHGILYRAIVEMRADRKPLDLITLTATLRDRGELDAVGGPAAVTHLYTFTPTAANASYYREIVEAKHRLREIIRVCTEAASRAYEHQSEEQSVALLDETEAGIFALRQASERSKDDRSIREDVLAGLDAIEQEINNRGKLSGLSTGLRGLDRMTSGLQPKNMIVVAARPSMGKTALCINIAEHVAVVEKKHVAIFSLEMSREELVKRMLCSRASLNLAKVRDGYAPEAIFPSLTAAADRLADSLLHIEDPSRLSINALRAKARRLKRRYDIALIVIDYLQLMSSTTRRAQENRQIEIAEISSGIKALAKELNIPIIVAAQLNRGLMSRKSKRPAMSDLRESGAIEADADVIALLHRDEYYAETDEEREKCAGEADLIIAKQRNGAVGDIKLTFLKQFTRFENRAEDRAAKLGEPLPFEENLSPF